jgi:uncharacterized RDD family membrane protein YckC
MGYEEKNRGEMKFKRLCGFFSDLLILCVVTQIFTLSVSKNLTGIFEPPAVSVFFISMALVLGKEGIKGRSPGKWLMGLQVVNASGNPIGIFDSFARNIFLPVWPLEAVAILFSDKRITDKYLKFNVVGRSNLNWKYRTLLFLFIFGALFNLDLKLANTKMLNEEPAVIMKEEIFRDTALVNETGSIVKYLNLKNGQIHNYEALFVSEVLTENGKKEIVSEVKFENGKWTYIRSKIKK